MPEGGAQKKGSGIRAHRSSVAPPRTPAVTYSPTLPGSTIAGLTALFGMGRGGSPPPSPPDCVRAVRLSAPLCPWERSLCKVHSSRRFRAISTGRLCRRRLYTSCLSTWSSPTALHGTLISETASRLDAFSAYPDRTWIPGGAAGATAGKPAVRPTRSSRTKVSPPQCSYARNR